MIPKSEYARLLERDEWLSFLEAAGVDNWEGYSETYDLRDEWRAEEAAKKIST